VTRCPVRFAATAPTAGRDVRPATSSARRGPWNPVTSAADGPITTHCTYNGRSASQRRGTRPPEPPGVRPYVKRRAGVQEPGDSYQGQEASCCCSFRSQAVDPTTTTTPRPRQRWHAGPHGSGRRRFTVAATLVLPARAERFDVTPMRVSSGTPGLSTDAGTYHVNQFHATATATAQARRYPTKRPVDASAPNVQPRAPRWLRSTNRRSSAVAALDSPSPAADETTTLCGLTAWPAVVGTLVTTATAQTAASTSRRLRRPRTTHLHAPGARHPSRLRQRPPPPCARPA